MNGKWTCIKALARLRASVEEKNADVSFTANPKCMYYSGLILTPRCFRGKLLWIWLQTIIARKKFKRFYLGTRRSQC
jgi:hypothetical protein